MIKTKTLQLLERGEREMTEDEEEIVCAMAGMEKFKNAGKADLASAVVGEIVDWDTERLRQAAARILWELNRRADEREI